MNDKITLDRETFKVLAADTRVEMLKSISSHKKTLSDLAGELGMSPSTVKEHLEKLVSVGLIYAEDKGMKWKYYKLTNKGRNIVQPAETKVWILLGTSFAMLSAAALMLYNNLSGFIASSGGAVMENAPRMLAAAPSPAEDAVAETASKAVEYGVQGAAAAGIPYAEFAFLVLSAVLFGACFGYLMRRGIKVQ